MPVFYQFRKWKAFKVWKDNVRSKKVQNAKRALEENLFFLNPVSILKHYLESVSSSRYYYQRFTVAPPGFRFAVMTVDSLLLNLIVIFVMVVFRCSLLRSFVPYFHTYKYSQRVCH